MKEKRRRVGIWENRLSLPQCTRPHGPGHRGAMPHSPRGGCRWAPPCPLRTAGWWRGSRASWEAGIRCCALGWISFFAVPPPR